MRIGRWGRVVLWLIIFSGCAVTHKATRYQPPRNAPDINIELYKSQKACKGTTLLADNHIQGRSKIIEVDMNGDIVWEYPIPSHLAAYTNPGFDVEALANGNILFVLPLNGIYEINRLGEVVWSHLDAKVTHDADRLPNGNTLYVFGGDDQKTDYQVKEIDAHGEIVWRWRAIDCFKDAAFQNIFNQGWTHANAVTRLDNGHTLISLRNFNLVAEVDTDGSLVRAIGRNVFRAQHDPEVLPNGNLLVMNHKKPHRAIEIDPKTDEVVWGSVGFGREMSPVRDADRLPNGNILITGTNTLLEYTPEGELVWRLNLNVVFSDRRQAPALGFYKAQRICR